jgi:hypothetical protein
MRVLISHDSRHQWKIAQELAGALRDAGVEPRIENLKAVCGSDAAKLQRELNTRYNYVIPVLSSSYMRDSFLVTELLEALMVEQLAKRTYVLPVLFGECYVLPTLASRLIDFRRVPFQEAFARLNARIADSKQVFVIMKLKDPELDSAYELAIRPTLEDFDFSPLRIDEVQDSGSITNEILHKIEQSVVVLADLTGERPNCYLEVGYALALEKELVLTCREGDRVHFDLEHMRIIYWKTEKELRDALVPRLTAIKQRARRTKRDLIQEPPDLALSRKSAKKRGAGGS